MVEFKMDRYSVVKKIGVGSYGAAYLIRRKKDGAQYVLKKIRLDNASPKERAAAHQVRRPRRPPCFY